MKNKPKVIVALSGGVDSTVAAYLLKKQGFQVEGAYMQVWSSKDYLGECPWEEDIKSAADAAKVMDITFRSIHLEDEYKKRVVSYMVDGYCRGITPNPDIMCNREIKFGVFLEWALRQRADYIATGHYARIVRSGELSLTQKLKTQNSKLKTTSKNSKVTTYFRLLKGVDTNKDQSYFLYTLTQEKLARILFPIGEYTKLQVRAIAKKAGLPNWDRKDSQGICFIGKVELARFLEEYIKPRHGDVVTTEGKKVGEHRGVFYYTIGQRHGLDIGSHTGTEAYYIAEKRLKDNVIVVAKGKDNPALYSKNFSCDRIHWISGEAPAMPFHCTAKIRYRQEDQKCVVKVDSPPYEGGGRRGLSYRVTFKNHQWSVAPGQSVVFYKREECLGGSIIMPKETLHQY